MSRGRAYLGAGAAAMMLSGCAGSTVISQEFVDPAYDPQLVGTMAKYGSVMPMEVHGNPFNVSQQELDSAMSSAMSGANFGPTARFLDITAREPRLAL